MRRTSTVIVLVALATAAAAGANYSGASPLLRFVIATVALAGLAWIVSFSTEQVGKRFGPAATGLLQSTLGNLPEFFVVVFALSAGEVVVAQTSISARFSRTRCWCSGWQSSPEASRALMESCASTRACRKTTPS